MFDQFKRIWDQLEVSQRVSITAAFVGILIVCVGLMFWASRPRMQLLYGGLDTKEMGEIAKTVESLGVKYEIRGGGTSIFVESGEVYGTRMKLAADGIPSGGGVGYEIFDSGGFGVSNFVQHTNFVRAIQGELSRTINQLNGVSNSKVMIVIPENELLVTGPEKKPTASVFVETGGRVLDIEAVDSIRSLVSNAVEGMNVNDVAVIDNNGNVLSAALADDGTLGMTSSQIKYRKGLEDYYTQKVETMLARVVGKDNVVVRVSVGLDLDLQTQVEEQFDPENQVVRSENVTENQVVSTETSSPSASGTDANLGGTLNDIEDDSVVSNSSETQKVKDTTFEISKRTIETVKNPGSINSLAAAVFLAVPTTVLEDGTTQPQPRSEEQLERLQLMVVNALGIEFENQEELDRKVTIEETEFQTVNMTAGVTGGGFMDQLPMIVDASKNLIAIGVSVFMLMFFFRMIKKSTSSVNLSGGLEVLPPEGGDSGPNSTSVTKDVTPTISPEILNELIKQNPDKVSSALKNWAFPDQ